MQFAVLALIATLVQTHSVQAQATEITRGRELQRASIEAYRAGDYPRFVDLTEKALAARPGHPSLLYNLAAGLALTGHVDRAILMLDRFAAYGLSASPQQDGDFDALRDDPRFQVVAARLKANAVPYERSTRGFSIDDAGFFAEGLAFDPSTKRFFITSLTRRSIFSVKDGHSSTFAALADGDLRSPLGVAVDSSRGLLWISASVVAEITDASAASSLIAFDLASGEFVKEVRHPSEAGSLGDVAVLSGGKVIVSDPLHGMVYSLSENGERLTQVVPENVLSSPQGIAAGLHSNTAFVSDYAQGIFMIDFEEGRTMRVPAPEESMLLGIDGLIAFKGALIAIQNGVSPARVLALELSENGVSIVSVRVLESNHSAHDEPTTGAIVATELWYIANGQWGRLSDAVAGELTASVPVVLRLSLESDGRGKAPDGTMRQK